MLEISIPGMEYYDEINCEFVFEDETKLQLEHSLLSISKWESKWNKPFLGNERKTTEQSIDYIRCMTITRNVNPDIYNRIDMNVMNQINQYVDSPMTATTFRKNDKRGKSQVITSELIYYWMVSYGIPFECEKWHLNRLLTLIRICNIKESGGGKNSKMPMNEVMRQNSALNAARRAKLGSKG